MIEGVFSLSKLAIKPVSSKGYYTESLLRWLRVSKEIPPSFLKKTRIGSVNMDFKDSLSTLVERSDKIEVGGPGIGKRNGGSDIYEPLGVIGNGKYHDLEAYLSYAAKRDLSTKSSVFRGNFYELNFLDFLRKNFSVSRVIHQGGRDDKGIDIRATWKPVENFPKLAGELGRPHKIFEHVNSVTRVKPIILKKNANIKLLVQCKSWEKSRIDAKMIREINGTLTNSATRGESIGAGNRGRRFLMMVCPTGFTRQGRIDFDKSLVPLIFIKFSKSRIKDPRSSPYDLDNYELGTFQSFYCNPMANALLKGLNWTEFMKLLVVEQK